jgi:hypothetical protein
MAVPLLGLIAEIGTSILGPLFGVIDQAVPDKDLATRLKADIQVAVLKIQEKTLDSQKEVIIAEAGGESYIQRTWRPWFMVFLMFNIAASMLAGLFGLADRMTDAWASIPGPAWTLMQVGIGGYIGGRTIEKVAKSVGPITWKK